MLAGAILWTLTVLPHKISLGPTCEWRIIACLLTLQTSGGTRALFHPGKGSPVVFKVGLEVVNITHVLAVFLGLCLVIDTGGKGGGPLMLVLFV